jgi:hypothetical protein
MLEGDKTDALKFYDEQIAKYSKASKGKLSDEIAQMYMDRADGDPDEARRLATADGYEL